MSGVGVSVGDPAGIPVTPEEIKLQEDRINQLIGRYLMLGAPTISELFRFAREYEGLVATMPTEHHYRREANYHFKQIVCLQARLYAFAVPRRD